MHGVQLSRWGREHGLVLGTHTERDAKCGGKALASLHLANQLMEFRSVRKIHQGAVPEFDNAGWYKTGYLFATFPLHTHRTETALQLGDPHPRGRQKNKHNHRASTRH